VFRATVPAASFEQWDPYYDEPRVRDYYERRRSGFEKMVGLLDRLLPERGRWLDVGCGPGGLLRAARGHGWEACGIEPSSAAVRAQMFGEVARTTVEDGLARFDALRVVSFVDMLRYVEHPSTVLAAARDRLVDGGWVMTTGDERRRGDGPVARLTAVAKAGAWPLSPCVHTLTAGSVYLGPNFLALGQR
jgi:SAM-dependent methyltransferase